MRSNKICKTLSTACNAMSLCKELRDIDTTLELRVAHPIKTGRRRSCECWPSSVKKVSDCRSRNRIYTDEPLERLLLACSGEERKIANDFSAAFQITIHTLTNTSFNSRTSDNASSLRESQDVFSLFRWRETVKDVTL